MNDLQNEITKYKQEAKPKTEDDKLQEILSSNNTSLKDKKLKELIQKNKELYVSFEKEKTMYTLVPLLCIVNPIIGDKSFKKSWIR